MKKNNLYIMIGIPCSGKTTLAQRQPGAAHVSRDTIRFSLLQENDNYFAREKEVFDLFAKTINNYLKLGLDVVADATHLNTKSRYKLFHKLSYNPNTTNVIAIYMNLPLETCLERNEKRKGTQSYVPPHEIYSMHLRLEPPTYREPFNYIYTYSSGDKMRLLERR